MPICEHTSRGMGNCCSITDGRTTWVERGKAPERLIASHSTDGRVDRTRPLCPYPQVAKYNGTGSIDDAASFVCR